MVEWDRDRLRVTFGQDAEAYDRFRPGYPPQLFADLAGLGVAGPGCRVLEIGCGTGQATGPLASAGAQVTAVELSPAMAAVARHRLVGVGAVDVVEAAFEDWLVPVQLFDLVLSATAFHWVDPAVRVTKAAAALRPGGVLAVVSTHHVRDGSAGGFFEDLQSCYKRFDPAYAPGLQPPFAAEVVADTSEFDRAGLFAEISVRRYQRDQEYTGEEFAGLLGTFSSTWAIPEPARSGFLACIRELIQRRHGGRIMKRYLHQVVLARRPG